MTRFIAGLVALPFGIIGAICSLVMYGFYGGWNGMHAFLTDKREG